MNDAATPKPEAPAPQVSLRPEQAADEAFLFEVYASTRSEELAPTGWDEKTRQLFLDQQFKAMRAGYRSMYPAGEFLIVERDQQRIGRLVVARGEDELRVVDLALLPAQRNRGIGTLLLQRVCAEATRAEKPVRLCVLKNNPAWRWYERLGFTRITEIGFYDELEWRPGGAPSSPTQPAG
jgi:ribosomal protein S18 acetylase RimI-like enzyme